MRFGGLKYRDVAKVLKDNGFTEVSTNGSHAKWRRGADTIIVPRISVNSMLWRRLKKEYGIDG